MKKLLLIALFAALPVSAKPTLEDCKTVSDLASQIMENRQYGVDMAKMYEIAKEDLSRQMILQAFEVPMYQTEKNKQIEISKFKNSWFKSCVKIM